MDDPGVQGVSIVPLWNWNFLYTRLVIKHHVLFQSYLYGIEISTATIVPMLPMCFNRTFMELKWARGLRNTLASPVSIVPLWNWNDSRLYPPGCGSRAFQSYLYGIEITGVSWTIQAYKVFQSYLYGIEISFTPGLSSNIMFCFNRTFMELKFLQLPSYPCCRCVSIVPLWNWNS